VAEVPSLYDEVEERPASIHDLKPKMRLEGTVARVELYGAFVDVGLEQRGLVHISKLSTQRVNRVSEVVSAGDAVRVWVESVEPNKGRINLTMIEPPAVEWTEIRAGQVYSGTVKRMEHFGAFVDIGATRDGLVHVSEITSDYIRDPKEYLHAGDEIQVKVLQVDHKKRRIELSIKALEDHQAAEEQVEALDETQTALEYAWRQATGKTGPSRRERRPKKARRQYREDDIFTRTLGLRGDQD